MLCIPFAILNGGQSCLLLAPQKSDVIRCLYRFTSDAIQMFSAPSKANVMTAFTRESNFTKTAEKMGLKIYILSLLLSCEILKTRANHHFISVGGKTVSFNCDSLSLPVWDQIRGTNNRNIAIGANKMARFKDDR